MVTNAGKISQHRVNVTTFNSCKLRNHFWLIKNRLYNNFAKKNSTKAITFFKYQCVLKFE